MTTTHSAHVSVLQVGDASVWQEGFADEQAKRAFGLYKRRVPGELLRHKTSALHRARVSSSPTAGPGAGSSHSTSPQSSTASRRGLPSHGPSTPLYNSFEPATPSLPPSQSLASFLSGQKGELDEEDEKQRLKREERFQSQRASLRPSRSTNQFQSVQRSVSDTKGKEKDVMNSWRQGCVEMMAYGVGGIYGGSLRISGDGIASRQVILAPLHKLKSDSAPAPIKDVRMLHPTLTSQMHVISLTLVLDVGTSNTSNDRQLGQLPKSLYEEEKSESLGRRPSTAGGGNASRKIAAFGKRARGLTLVAGSAGSSGHPEEGVTRKGSASASSGSVTLNGGESQGHGVEQTFLLSFDSMAEQWEWYTLFLSLCPPSKAARTQRRLSIKILDLQERNIPNGHHGRGEEASVHLGPSIDTRSVRLRDGKEKVRPGWAVRERLCCEVILDGLVYGRTSWQAAEERSSSPFWGENVDLDDLPDFDTCTVKLYRMYKHRAVAFASVDIPVMSSFAKQRDERYPIMVETTVIGELRLMAEYHEFVVLPRENYADLQLTRCDNGLGLVYALAAKGSLDGLSDLLVRIGIASGTLLNWLREMCKFEAQASGETLFRGNTLLSKTLEATMRSFCFDFLVRSIGPTIERILAENVALELHITTQANGVVVLQDEGLEGMRELVKDCWNDMYHARDAFPEFVRHVLFHLFKAVKEHHAADEEKLKFKAVSSFLFLRLIGPALMRPHLFGLADGMPSPGVRKTLTLLAKVLHALAFFTEKDGRDPELACFTHFIKDNAEAMIDYLSSLTTPLESTFRPPPLSPVGCLVAERVARAPTHLGERTPVLATAGPLDLSADLAVLYNTLRERKQSTLLATPFGQNGAECQSQAEKDLDRILDDIAENTETARMRKLSLASSHRGSISTTDTGYATARGRPSLSLSIDSAGTPPLPSRPLDPEARRKSSTAGSSTRDGHPTPRLSVQTPGTGSTLPTVLQTPLSQRLQETGAASPTSPVSPVQPSSPRSPILGATNSFRNKLSASASWRWLSFGGAGSAVDARADPLAQTEKQAHGSEMSPGSSRTRVSIQPTAISIPSPLREHNTPSPVRKARSASAAPTRHARSGSTSLPASPALPRDPSYPSSRASSNTLSGLGQSRTPSASRVSSLAQRQNSYSSGGGQAYANGVGHGHAYRPSTSHHPSSSSFGVAPKDRQSVAPAALGKYAADTEDADAQARNGRAAVGLGIDPKGRAVSSGQPRRPERSRDRPATATVTGSFGFGTSSSSMSFSGGAQGLDAELGEVSEKRKGRLMRSGTVGGSARSTR